MRARETGRKTGKEHKTVTFAFTGDIIAFTALPSLIHLELNLQTTRAVRQARLLDIKSVHQNN